MAIPNYQEILDLLKNGLTLEAREKILELREAALRLQEENLSLKEKLKQFQVGFRAVQPDAFRKGRLLAAHPNRGWHQPPGTLLPGLP